MTGATGPLADGQVVDAIGADARAAGYTVEGVADLLGPDADAALTKGALWPAIRATGNADPARLRLAVLVNLFLLGRDETVDRVTAALPSVGVDALTANGVVEPAAQGQLRAVLDIRPHGDDTRDYLVVSDRDTGGPAGSVRHDYVLGIGGAALSLARAVVRTPVARALDLGVGSGVQSLHLATHADEVVATDTNPRALAVAAATARLNGMSWDLRLGSLFEPVAGERFDLIVSNPPFVVGAGSQDYLYRDSGMAGDSLCQHIIEQIPDHLQPGGTAQIMANWMVRPGQDWRQRVGGWLAGNGLDAWVVQREFADPVSYVSLWLADAGESAERAIERGAQWLDWFDQEGIAGVGMGTICLRASGGRTEHVLEEITGAGEELTGPEVDAFFARRRYLREHSDDHLLAARLSTAPVFLEQHSLPGPDGWQQVGAVVRRPGGPGATISVDEVFTALLAGCRGEVALGTLIELLAAVHGVDAGALAQAAMPVIREAIGRGILHQAN
ncbi:MAG: methyltransferase [Mycobacterium sp.]